MLQKMSSLQLLFICFWIGLVERVGSQKGCRRHLQTGCKTHLIVFMILKKFGSKLGSLFSFFIVGPALNVRLRNAFSMRSCFGGVQMPRLEIWGFGWLDDYVLGLCLRHQRDLLWACCENFRCIHSIDLTIVFCWLYSQTCVQLLWDLGSEYQEFCSHSGGKLMEKELCAVADSILLPFGIALLWIFNASLTWKWVRSERLQM